ncbi:hypothetical protein ACEPPN_007707 [Leptodophora sp. 'Broadleaf-Isolate-01']
MANASVVANGTGIASVGDGNGVLRVYSVDIYGGIRETGYNGSGSTWWGGDKPIATGKIGSPLAVAASPGLKHGRSKSTDSATKIRLYYISTDFKLSELCYDADSSSKGWFPGELSGKGFQIAPYSQIAAAYLSTDQLKIRVYYQTPNLDLIEKAHENTGVWHTGEFSVKSAVPRAAISATVWTWSSGTGIRVYYTGANDLILEKANDGAWYDGAFRQLSVPGSRVGSLSWYASSTKAPEIRVYFQGGEQVTAVTEWKWQGGLGAWNIGHKALPPAAQ